jgi:hypothetical protein
MNLLWDLHIYAAAHLPHRLVHANA